MKFRHRVIALVLSGLLTNQHLLFAGAANHAPLSQPNSSGNPRLPGTVDPSGQAAATPQSDNGVDDLKIVVLEGEDATNIIKKETAVQPVVEVRDRNNLPVAGIAVVFTTPGFGPSGVFVNGGHTFSVVTDSAGRAAVNGMKPTGGSGSFKISVSAHGAGHSGTATISQTNVLKPVGSANSTAMSPTHLAIIGGIAAAVVVGIVVGINKSGGSSSSQPTGTIGAPGTPTITGPH